MNAPVLLCTECTAAVLLPQVVVRAIEDDVFRKALLNTGDGSLLVRFTWYCEFIGLTLGWPASLSDYSSLAPSGLRDLLYPV